MNPDNLTDSTSDGIDGGTCCNFIFSYRPTGISLYTTLHYFPHPCRSNRDWATRSRLVRYSTSIGVPFNRTVDKLSARFRKIQHLQNFARIFPISK